MKLLVSIVLFVQTIETVEQEVERLLEEDALADEVKYGMSMGYLSIYSH